jgi:hypothetical protein
MARLLAVLADPDDKVRAALSLLVAYARQAGGELRIRRDLIDATHAGLLLEEDPDAVTGYMVLRVVEYPPDLVHTLVEAHRAIEDECCDADPTARPFVVIPCSLGGR